MPLIVGVLTPPPVEPPEIVEGPCFPGTSWPGDVSLLDHTGRIWDLSDGSDGIWEQPGRLGFDVAPRTHQVRTSPAFDGAILQGIRILPRELIYPAGVVTDTPDDF